VLSRFILFTALFAFLMPATSAEAAHDGLITKSSDYGVQETMNRLEAVFKKKGITVFAKINHTAGAEKIKAKLAPTQVMIMGTPKIGTPLMQSDQHIGIDLPLKVLVWQNTKGVVSIAYNDPKYLSGRHHIKNRDKVFGKMAGALNKLTNAAIKKPMPAKK
jgi:uncharacterized protein (DUF302 family)